VNLAVVGNVHIDVGNARCRADGRPHVAPRVPARPLATRWPTVAHVASLARGRTTPAPDRRSDSANKLCLQARLFPRA
jgi:hypothetical protein